MSRLPDLRRAERMACRVLAARRITTLPVEPLSLLRACRDTAVLTCAEAAEQLDMSESRFDRLFNRTDAVTFQYEASGASRYIVVYRPGGNPARLRFTLAHELGHRLLGHRGGDAAEEREADHFASHLLCPEPVVSYMKKHASDAMSHQLATACYVSSACAQAAANRPASQVEKALQDQLEEQFSDALKILCPPSHTESW